MLAAVRAHPGVANFIFCHLCCKSVEECLSLHVPRLPFRAPLLPGFILLPQIIASTFSHLSCPSLYNSKGHNGTLPISSYVSVHQSGVV